MAEYYSVSTSGSLRLRAAATGPIRGFELAYLRTVLHKLTWMGVLCIGLGLASVPAAACCGQRAPVPDCCPHGPQTPGLANRSPLGSIVVAENCCAAGPTNTAAITAAAGTIEVRQRPHRADPPASRVSQPLPAAAFSRSAYKQRLTESGYSPSGATLYLHTGRLRL